MKTGIILTAFIFMLGISTVMAQEPKEMKIIGKAKKLDNNELMGTKDQNGNLCAGIKVISDMEGFTFDSNDGIIKVEHRPGEDVISLTPTERVLKIHKTGYLPLKIILSEYGIILKSQEIWQITVTGEKEEEQIPVTIRYTPSDAEMLIDDKQVLGSSHLLNPGIHKMKIVKDGYQTIEKEITVDKQHIFFEETLEKVKKILMQVETSPAGATVYLDEIRLGDTPLSVYYQAGNYTMKVVKAGFIALEEPLVVSTEVKKTYTLRENVGYLTINTSQGASVYFNDVLIKDPKKVKLEPQLLIIRVTLPKAEPLIQEVTVNRGDDLVLDMIPVVPAGSLQVAVVPFDSKVLLTGDDGEKFTSDGSKTFENIPVGDYTLTISRDGYESSTEKIKLKTNEMVEKTIRLELQKIVYASSVQINVYPSFATIQLSSDNGYRCTLTGDISYDKIPAGSYALQVNCSGYRNHSETVVLKAGEPFSRTIDLSPKKEFTLFENLGYSRDVGHNNKNHETRISFGPRVAFSVPFLVLGDDDTIHGVNGPGYELGFRSEFWGNRYLYFTLESDFSGRRLINYWSGEFNDGEKYNDDRFHYIDIHLIMNLFGAIEFGYARNMALNAKDIDGREIIDQINKKQDELITGLYVSRKHQNVSGFAMGIRAYWGLDNLSEEIGRLSHKTVTGNVWLSYVF